MKKLILFSLILFSFGVFAQQERLPHYLTPEEEELLKLEDWTTPYDFSKNIEEPPPHPVRHMAEWEELETLVIAWSNYRSILREIVRYSKEEVPVLITFDPNDNSNNYNSQTAIENYLTAGGLTLDNVNIMEAPNNTVWSRDYLQNTVYANDVEDRLFADWVYNRPRPKDDTMAYRVGAYLNTPVYSMTASPTRLVNTGGNFMSDGLGSAFSSRLIFEENEAGNQYGAGPHDEAAIDDIHQQFMGIERYIKFETLDYDVINHIDMHMHLLDEETIVFGEYPTGISDGPQIEANIQYLQGTYLSAFGEPYKIERVIQPPDFGGFYPVNGGDYRTYTNFVFVNGTILLPVYEEQYDTIAIKFYEDYFPGYKVRGINCNSMISALGALHCITKEVGVHDPLWIVHQKQTNIDDNNQWNGYEQFADIQHRTGIESANLYWTIDTTAGYEALDMTLVNAANNTWAATIPQQANGTEIFYYIEGNAVSGKSQVRPLPAPTSYYHFTVNDGGATTTEEQYDVELQDIYPNPASAITVIPLQATKHLSAEVELLNVIGQQVDQLFSGDLQQGLNNVFLDARAYKPGPYFVRVKTDAFTITRKLVIQ